MGWNRVHRKHNAGQSHPLWRGIPEDSFYYFVHSFYAVVQQPQHCAAEADYGGRFFPPPAPRNNFSPPFLPPKRVGQGPRLVCHISGLEPWTPFSSPPLPPTSGTATAYAS